MNTYKGSTLKATLSTITADHIPDSLWDELPDHVAGAHWKNEVADMARTLSDWLTENEEYEPFQLQDMTALLADSEVEDYYRNINSRVQELSLWAVGELDEEVAQGGFKAKSLTDMNSAYLYCAMRGLCEIIAKWAMSQIDEMAEVA